MLYSNKDTFVMSTPGTGGFPPDSLETIMSGNADGATGCCITADMTADGLAVLSVCGELRTAKKDVVVVRDLSFSALRECVPQVVTIGQALELAKACAGKVAITLRDPAVFPAAKVALTISGISENCYFTGLSLIEAAHLAAANPNFHFIGDLPDLPADYIAIIRATRETGLFGLRVSASAPTRSFVEECRRSGLFVASTETSDADRLENLLNLGINFIETARPDLATALTPSAGTPGEDDMQLTF